MKTAKRPMTPEKRQQLIEGAIKSTALSEELLLESSATRALSKAARRPPHSDVLNALELACLLLFDIACLLEDLLKAEGFRAKLYARALIITVHESCLTLRSLLGPKFRRQIIAILGPSCENALKVVHHQFHDLFERSNSDFGELRDGIIGHRDHDPDTRLRLLTNVDKEAITAIAVDVLEAIMLLSIHLKNYVIAVRKQMSESLSPEETKRIKRAEIQIPCTKCDKSFPESIEKVLDGQLSACPHCGSVMSLKTTDN